MSSIERVLERHGEEIRAELLADAGTGLVRDVVLENNIYEIQVYYLLADGTQLEGRSIDIDGLAERFPDCEASY
jgi:hypothetical protein